MSFFRATDQSKYNIPNQGLVGGVETGIGEVFTAAFAETRAVQNIDASQRLLNDQFRQAKNDFLDITGQQFEPKMDETFTLDDSARSIKTGVGPVELRKRELQAYDKVIRDLKQNDPGRYKNLKTLDDLKEGARKDARLSQREFQDASERASPFAAGLGGFAGGLAGGFTDPVNLLTLPLGAGASGTVLRKVLIEAGINASLETISQPEVARWNREIGNKYGMSEALQGIGSAAILGGTFAGIGPAFKGGIQLGSHVFRRMSDSKLLKSLSKRSAKYMGRVAHIEEANPFLRAIEREKGRHYASAELIVEALDAGRNPMRVDLPITSREFNEIDTSSRGLDNATDINRAKEIARFQTKVDDTDAPKDITRPSLKPSVEKKLEGRTGTIALNEFLEPEVRALRKSGLEPDPQTNTFQVKDVKKVLDDEALGPQTQPRQFEPPSDFKVDEVFKEASTELEKAIDIEDFDNGLVAADVSLQRQKEILRESTSPETISAHQKSFDDLVEANPNAQITLDDRTISLKNLVKEFSDDEKFVREVSFCGVG